jgi:hypothetical protein
MPRLRVARFLLRLSHSHNELVKVKAVNVFTMLSTSRHSRHQRGANGFS